MRKSSYSTLFTIAFLLVALPVQATPFPTSEPTKPKPTRTPTPTPSPTPTWSATPTSVPGCNEAHIAMVGQVNYPLQGCPGHAVTIYYSDNEYPWRSLRIKGVYGEPPQFPSRCGCGGCKALSFFWVFETDPFFGEFIAEIVFQYNLADLPPWMRQEDIQQVLGWTDYGWRNIWSSFHNPYAHTFTLSDQTQFYRYYTIGRIPGDCIDPVPMLGSLASIFLTFALGLGIMLFRGRYEASQ